MSISALEAVEKLTDLRGDHSPKDYSERISIDERHIFVGSDVHVPYHDEALVAKFISHAADESADAIVWLGDLMDNPVFSSWGCEDLTTTFDNELDQVEGIIRLAAKAVDVQYWSIGNHEMRWMRRMGYQGNMSRLAKMAGLGDLLEDGSLIVSDNPSLDYYYGEWMLTHPAEYGSTPLVVPGKLADRYLTNVVSAHAHHWGMGISPSGLFTVIESGCLLEPDYVAYINNRVTTHRAWVKGYVELESGHATIHRG